MTKNATPVIAILNARWRVVDDPLQWILQRRRGNRWRDERFCRDRDAMIGITIKELCGTIDPAAMSTLRDLPRFHPSASNGRAQSVAATPLASRAGVVAPGSSTLFLPRNVSPAFSDRAALIRTEAAAGELRCR